MSLSLLDLSLEQKVLNLLKHSWIGKLPKLQQRHFDVAQPIVGRVLSDFIESMVKLALDFIFMPKSNNKIGDEKRDFNEIAGFPWVIGCTDGSHIAIIAPHQNEFAYVN